MGRMRRDSDLIRAILLAVEADRRCEVLHIPRIEGYGQEAIHFHVLLLTEKGLLRAALSGQSLREPWLGVRLTWEGYDFLDHIRDPAVWRAVKKAAGKVGSWSIETLAAVAKAIVAAQIAELGLAA